KDVFFSSRRSRHAKCISACGSHPCSTNLSPRVPAPRSVCAIPFGSVIMIIDPHGIAQTVGSAGTRGEETEVQQSAQLEKMVSLLVFRAGSQQPKAVPLSLVTRLEEIDCKKIELSNGRHLVQYRGQLMPLVRVSDEGRVRNEGAQPLLVFSDGGRPMGLVH